MSIFSKHSIATVIKKSKIRVQNGHFAGNRNSQDKFNELMRLIE
jgi:hypothetical protein